MFFKPSNIISVAFKDLMGQRFGRLVAIGIENRDKNTRNIIWQCLCDCGNLVNVRSGHLRNGNTKSCGCFRLKQIREALITHGKYKTREYSIWKSMLTRCNNPNHEYYSDYGGRGIKVCERWKKFENFYADMGDASEGKTLDRKDVNGNYEYDNCRWATWTEQNLNKRVK